MSADRKLVCFATDWPDYRLQAGLLAFAKANGWRLLDLDHRGSWQLRMDHADGMIVNTSRHKAAHDPRVGALRKDAERWRCPLINLTDAVLDWPVPAQARVVHDDHAIGCLAAQHLIDLGHQRLAYHWRRPIDEERHGDANPHGAERERGFRETAEAAGVALELSWGSEVLDRSGLIDRLHALPKPIALLCANDFQATALCDLCAECHIDVPGEIAILGVEDDPLICPNTTPALSSIDSNREEQGYRAAEALARLMAGEHIQDAIRIHPRQVVARRSTDRVAIANPDVSHALAVIAARYRDNIGAEEVVAAVGVPRTTLYREFRRHLNHSIAAEITRLRIQHACALLANPKRSIAEIASSSGFSDAQHMRRTFVRDKGLSPRAYREQVNRPAVHLEDAFALRGGDDPMGEPASLTH